MTAAPQEAATPGPRRIQLRRTKGWRKPAGAVVVSRPSKWGNPHRPRHQQLFYMEVAVAKFRHDMECDRARFTVADVRRELRGKDLACWCKPGAPCHADVLLEMANR